MGDLPSGSVTFMFSDIVDSTRLVKAARDLYPRLLAEHQLMIRAAIASHSGFELDTQGDAFLVAFASAKQATMCALDIQRAFVAHDWPRGLPVAVRIGIHTGQAAPADGRYTGPAVHRAARVCAAADGGQVLLAQATPTILEDEEEGQGFRLLDTGQHRLKGFDRPALPIGEARPRFQLRNTESKHVFQGFAS